MKKIKKVLFSVILASATYSVAWAEDPYLVQLAQTSQSQGDKLDKLIKYFTNYSSYFYIDPSQPWNNRSQGEQGNLPSTFDINEISAAGRALVFNSLYFDPAYSTIFNSFSSANSGVGNISANATVDQPFPGTGGNFAANPVSQHLLNNLNTAVDEYNCYDPNCLSSPAAALNIVGTGLLTQQAATARLMPNLSQTILDQLNVDTLLGPLTYSVNNPGAGTGSPFGGGSQNQPGLSSANQAQQANNFIRHLAGGILPVTLPTLQQFRNYMTTWQDSTQDQGTRTNARTEILRMISGMRTSASQLSVGLSNLYFAFMRRMPNPATTNKSPLQTEYEMATRRLYNPAQGAVDWHNQMEQADITTLLREINYTLAEINYQLYLNREFLERNMIATSTVVLEQQQFMRSMISGDTAVTSDFTIPIPKYSF